MARKAIDEARRGPDHAPWAFVFLPDRAHLSVGPNRPDHDMAAILKAIKGPVGRRAIAHLEGAAPGWLPRVTRLRSGREERLFRQSGGGHDRNVEGPGTPCRMIDYLRDNPARRGLVARASDRRWSSASWSEGRPPSPLQPDAIPPDWAG